MNYTALDWTELSSLCKLMMYSTFPESNEPVDKPSISHSPQVSGLGEKSFDEVMEEVLEDRAEAWERLADL
jgi:hypothetical protein